MKQNCSTATFCFYYPLFIHNSKGNLNIPYSFNIIVFTERSKHSERNVVYIVVYFSLYCNNY